MLSMLIAYDAAGDVVATLDYLVARGADGRPAGMVDFAAQEQAGQLTAVWSVSGAAGSGSWPEWIGPAAVDFRVHRAGGRIVALEHRASGYRRERAAVEQAIARRLERAGGAPVDIRDLVGGPARALVLTSTGRTQRPTRLPDPPELPLAGME